MAWLIYTSLILAGTIHPDFDKLGLVILAIYTCRYISFSTSWPFFCLALLLVMTTPFVGGTGNLLYAAQFLIIGFIFSGSTKFAQHPEYFAKHKNAFYICHAGAVLFGAIQAVLWSGAGIPILLDVFLPGKYDSIFTNPNPFGIVSGVAFVMICLDQALPRNKKIILAIIFLIGVFLSRSSSAMLLPLMLLAAYLVRVRFKIFLVSTVIIIASVFIFAPEMSELFLNKRLMIWRFGLDQLAGNYMIGIGFGEFQKIARNFIGNFGVHSLYIEVLISGGIVGFILFILGIIKPLFQKSAKRQTSLPYFGILLISLVESLLLFDEIVLLCLLLALATLHSQNPSAT